MKSNQECTQITYWYLAVLRDYANADNILAKIPNTEDVNRLNNTGRIPLLYAIANNSIQVINMLLRKGGDVNFSAPNGDTSVSLALERGDPEILQSLISFGAKLSSEESQKASSILSRVILKKSELPDTSESVTGRVNEFSLKRGELERKKKEPEENRRKKHEAQRKLEKVGIQKLIEEQKIQGEIEEREFEQLVAEIKPLGFTESRQVSWYIMNNRLGLKYKNISGIVKMEQDGTSWDYKGGFPPNLYARLCEELELSNQGTKARVVGFKPFKDL